MDGISALGLRHVGHGIPTVCMSPFVTACLEVLQGATPDEEAVESFGWSLALVSKILIRTVTEGSTIVMKAVNNNSVKNLKKAVTNVIAGCTSIALSLTPSDTTTSAYFGLVG